MLKGCTIPFWQNFLLILYLYWSIVYYYHWVPSFWNHMLVRLFLRHCKIDEISRSLSFDRSLYSKDFTSNDLSREAIFFVDWDLITLEFLILRLAIFAFFVQINPKLESIRRFIKTSRHLCMEYAFTCSHPLDIARSNSSFVSFEVFMIHWSR